MKVTYTKSVRFCGKKALQKWKNETSYYYNQKYPSFLKAAGYPSKNARCPKQLPGNYGVWNKTFTSCTPFFFPTSKICNRQKYPSPKHPCYGMIILEEYFILEKYSRSVYGSEKLIPKYLFRNIKIIFHNSYSR